MQWERDRAFPLLKLLLCGGDVLSGLQKPATASVGYAMQMRPKQFAMVPWPLAGYCHGHIIICVSLNKNWLDLKIDLVLSISYWEQTSFTAGFWRTQTHCSLENSPSANIWNVSFERNTVGIWPFSTCLTQILILVVRQCSLGSILNGAMCHQPRSQDLTLDFWAPGEVLGMRRRVFLS